MQASLFSDKPEQTIQIPDGDVSYIPGFIDNHIDIFEKLKKQIEWSQDEIFVYGKTHKIPRLQAWYGDPQCSYRYSGLTMQPKNWTTELQKIRSQLEIELGVKFNCVLCNLYRDGKDYVAWHADDEPELGRNPVIASLSLGETRTLHLKHRYDKGIGKVKIDLAAGSLFVMRGKTQENWHHQLAKTSRKIGSRINLTFRMIKK